MEITPTRRRNYQRRFGRAQRTLGALDMGLVRPKQLDKTPSQLQRMVQRLTSNPIITTEKSGEQPESVHPRAHGSNKMIVADNSESVHPRSSVFHRIKTSNASELVTKKASVFDRLEAFFVQKFKDPSKTEVRKRITSPVTSEIKKMPVLEERPEAKMQWRPKRIRIEAQEDTKEVVPEIVSEEPVVTKHEPKLEVHSPVIQDTFNVELVKQQWQQMMIMISL